MKNCLRRICIVLIFLSALEASAADFSSMLIVTHDDYLEAADSLAAWRQQMGYTISVVSHTSWTEDQLKDTTHHYIKDLDYDFLCFLGDIDKVPSESHWQFGYLTNTNDLYFACIDGPDDYIPDAGYGRISIANADQAMATVLKIINYERLPVSDPDFYNKAVTIGQFQGGNRETAGYTETSLIVRDYLIGHGYQVDKIFITDSSISPTTLFSGKPVPDSLRKPNYAWDGNDVQISEVLNEGRFLATYRDHGLAGSWSHPYYDTTHVRALTNGSMLPVIFSICCETGQFFMEHLGFCESLLRHPDGGAVGVIGSQLTSNAQRNNNLLKGLIDAIWPSPGLQGNPSREPVYEMGLVMNRGKEGLPRVSYEKYIYHGDPTTKIWTQSPQEITVTHDDHLSEEQLSFEIADISCSIGIATLWFEDRIIGRSHIRNNIATLELETLQSKSGCALLTITQHNYRPYQSVISIGNVLVRGNRSDKQFTGKSINSICFKNGKFAFNLPLKFQNEPVQIWLTSIDGKVLYQFDKDHLNTRKVEITLNNKIPAGIYTLVLKGENYSFNRKVIISY